MRDPYQVLGVPSTATDDEVKKAYRDLARKYHPDNYHDNPLADLAQERMKEINEAYETIQSQRKAARSGGGYSGTAGYGGYNPGYNTGYSSAAYGAGTARLQRVRMAISQGNLNLAEELLNAQSDHDAEWNFLKGVICTRRGWLDEARRYYQTAVPDGAGQRGVPAGTGYVGGAAERLPAQRLRLRHHRQLRQYRLSAAVRHQPVLQRAGRACLFLLTVERAASLFPIKRRR